MNKNNKRSIVLMVFAVIFCISAAMGTVSATAPEDTTQPTVTADLAGGTYTTAQTVTLTADDSSATIYYTNDSTDPRTSSTRIQYTGPITISKTTTLRYAAVDPSNNWSPLYLQNYVIGTGTATNNTGQSNYTGPQTNNTDWSYTVTDGCRIDSSAAVGSDGTIYFGTINGETKEGYFYAFNPNGTLKWRYHTGGIRSTPIIGSDGTIYVKSYNGTEYAFNPNGTLKWSSTETTANSGFATIGADGTKYIVTNGLLYAYNPDGTLKWTYNTETMYGIRLNTLSGTPIIGADGTIYAVGRYNVVYQDSTIGTIIATQKCNLYAINPDGTTKWTYDYGYSTDQSLTVGRDGTIYFCLAEKLYAFKSNGEIKWTFNHGSNCAPSIGADGTIYLESWGTIYALTPVDGILKWTYSTNCPGYDSITIGADGTLYFGVITSLQVYGTDIPGYSDLYALNPDGTLKWKHHVGGVSGSPAIGPNGTLYVGGYASGEFYAIKDDATKPTVTAKPAGGTYYTPQNVTLTTTDKNATKTYYTIDGTDPTSSSTRKQYTGAITINKTTTLKFAAVDSWNNWSSVYTQKYTIYKKVAYTYKVKVPYKKGWYKYWYKVSYKKWYKSWYKYKGKLKYKWKYKWATKSKYKMKYGWIYKTVTKTGAKNVLT